MSRLTIGTLALSPAFDPDVTDYTVTTSNNSNKVTATATDASAVVSIAVNGTNVDNESQITWEAGENVLTVVVTNGGSSKTYTVTVTKGA